MKLTGPERLILIMLSDIHEKLGIENSVEPEFIRSAIYSDNEWGLSWRYTGIMGSEASPPKVSEVVNTLDMWSFLEESLSELTADETRGLDEAIKPFTVASTKFTGYDGNNETEYMGIARFLIDDLKRFQRFKGRELNSHLYGSAETYRRMGEVFEPIRKTLMDRRLNVSELRAIILEKVHPENRRTAH